MRKNIVLAVLLFFSVPAVAQIQALKGLASLAIPDAGLEEIHGEVVALTSDVGKDVEILNATPGSMIDAFPRKKLTTL